MPRTPKSGTDGYNKAFPMILRKLIEGSGKPKKKLAEYLNKSGQAVSYYCDGTSSPDWETIVAIAKYFHVSTDYLLGVSPDDTPNQTTRSVCKYTGLSSTAVEYLHAYCNQSVRSFYRKYFDYLLRHGEENIANVPSYIIEAAQAAVIAEREKEETISLKRSVDNRVCTLSKDGTGYKISAKEAESHFIDKASEEVSKAIAEALGELQSEVEKGLKENGGEINVDDFIWISIDDEELEGI